MASFYELTEEEVKLLLEALEYFKIHQGTFGEWETKLYRELKDYLETRERPPVIFTDNIYHDNVRGL